MIYNFRVSSYTNLDTLAHKPRGNNGKGIYHIELNHLGKISIKNVLDISDNVAFLKKHPRLPLLYAVTETITQLGEILLIDISGGDKLIDRYSTYGKSSCYLELNQLSPDNTTMFVTNYWDSKLISYNVFGNGKLSKKDKICLQRDNYLVENNPSREDHWLWRQNWSHAHCIVTEPYTKSKSFLVDLGKDKIIYYRTKDLKMLGEILLPESFGPRHLVFHPSIPIVYLVNELNSTVSVFKYQDSTDDHKLKIESYLYRDSLLYQVQNLSCLPHDYDLNLVNDQRGWKANSHASEIRIHPNKQFLYISNRGHDSITLFQIKDDGYLVYIRNIPSGGETPRNFNLSRDGRFMIVGNQDSNNLTSFRVEDDGDLTKIDTIHLPSPNYVYSI